MIENVKIIKLNNSGEGIGKINNKIIFIPNTLPQEEVQVKIIKEYSKYYLGKVEKIITKSPDRITPNCPYYDKCGGCQLQHLSYAKELDYKVNNVKEIFSKYNHLDINPSIIKSKNILSYRNKITLHVKDNILGLQEEKSHNIIPITQCLLVSPQINKVINLLTSCDLSMLNKIVIKESTELLLVLYGTVNTNDLSKLSSIVDNIVSITSKEKIIKGKNYILNNLNKYQYKISSESFFQINNYQTVNLYNYILNNSKNSGSNLIDLYCGTGSIGIYLSKYFKKIYGIEINKAAIKDASDNLYFNHINNYSFVLGDVSKKINNQIPGDVIVVDPPRKGLDNNTINIMKQINPKKIIYVSCNPITLSRDLNSLLDSYQLGDIKLFDMFPRTYHIETVCVLERSNDNE